MGHSSQNLNPRLCKGIQHFAHCSRAATAKQLQSDVGGRLETRRQKFNAMCGKFDTTGPINLTYHHFIPVHDRTRDFGPGIFKTRRLTPTRAQRKQFNAKRRHSERVQKFSVKSRSLTSFSWFRRQGRCKSVARGLSHATRIYLNEVRSIVVFPEMFQCLASFQPSYGCFGILPEF